MSIRLQRRKRRTPVLAWRGFALAAPMVVLGFAGSAMEVAAHEGHAESAESWPSRLISAPAPVAFLVSAIGLGAVGLWFIKVRSDGRRGKQVALFLAAAVVTLPAIGVAALGATESSAGNTSHTQGNYEGIALDGTAPGFALTDQRGEPLDVSDLRGQVVLLAFLDPNCTDICPLTALHFRQVSEELGPDASQVALLAVNANPGAASVDDVAAATQRWGVDSVSTWHFLTGDPDRLEAIRDSYGVLGGVPKADNSAEVAHTPGIFVIDQAGERRWYVSVPENAFLDQDWAGPPLTELLLKHVRQLLDE